MLSDNEFKRLLEHFDRPWAGYRKVRKGVKKRIRRHMTGLHTPSLLCYLDYLGENPAEIAVLEGCLRVTISRLFRDRALWDYLRDVIFPKLLSSYPEGLRIWSAGCAGGEEVYSLAIVLDLLKTIDKVSILATDLNEGNIERAKVGCYDTSSLKEVSEELQDLYFTEGPRGKFSILPSLQKHISWQKHDLLSRPPEDAYHLVFLRNNLLTYHRGAVLRDTLLAIVERITPQGILIIGSHERIKGLQLPLRKDGNHPFILHKTGEKLETCHNSIIFL